MNKIISSAIFFALATQWAAASEDSGSAIIKQDSLKAQQRTKDVLRKVDEGSLNNYMPSEKEISAELAKIQDQRKMFKEEKSLDIEGLKNIFPSIATPNVSGVDIEAIAKKYENKVQAQKSDDVLIFISFSMPKESLVRTIKQANSIGATLMLRGFKNNSWKETLREIAALDVPTGNISINPNAYIKYKVNAVPAFVLVKADSADTVDLDGCALPENYSSIAGDVSLRYALEKIAEADAEFGDQAAKYLNQIKG